MNFELKRKKIWPRWPIFLLHSLWLFPVTACGKPASPEDCEQIIARITELELKAAQVADAEEIEAQVAQTQTAFKDRMMSDCVGNRISQGALACVKQAVSAREIVEECFD